MDLSLFETYPTFHKLFSEYAFPLSISEMEKVLKSIDTAELTEREIAFYYNCKSSLQTEKLLRINDIAIAKENGK